MLFSQGNDQKIEQCGWALAISFSPRAAPSFALAQVREAGCPPATHLPFADRREWPQAPRRQFKPPQTNGCPDGRADGRPNVYAVRLDYTTVEPRRAASRAECYSEVITPAFSFIDVLLQAAAKALHGA